MKLTDIARERLRNQLLTSTRFKKPAAVVRWLGAVQAQEYNGAKWALGQRLPGATDSTIERAIADGEILRTHVMRPTWHFVTPADIRWMLALTAPRVLAICRHAYRHFELDDRVFKQTNRVLGSALEGGRQLTRDELRSVLERFGIPAPGLRFLHILARAELEGIICSGGRKGKQITYARLDERVPRATDLTREEALAELTRRYFTSHGPATVRDFVWWSGLTTTDARAGIEMVQHRLLKEVIDGDTYWLPPSSPNRTSDSRTAHLLPTYDEYFIGYKDRSAAIDLSRLEKTKIGNLTFVSPIVLRGRVIGKWNQTLRNGVVGIHLRPFISLKRSERRAIDQAVQRYGEFLQMRVTSREG